MDPKVAYMKALLRPEKGIVNVVPIVPFANWDYYYITQTLAWKPDATDAANFDSVTVPVGFVTDLASTPEILWSLLPPAGPYSYAAIIHDYLYWFQPPAKLGGDPREYADSILEVAMRELKVSPLKAVPIVKAVRAFGGGAWRANATAVASGEKRVLKAFPTDPTTTWEQWKAMPGVFV